LRAAFQTTGRIAGGMPRRRQLLNCCGETPSALAACFSSSCLFTSRSRTSVSFMGREAIHSVLYVNIACINLSACFVESR
jgi:hypothetical protein